VSECEELVGGKITAPLSSTYKNNVEQLKLKQWQALSCGGSPGKCVRNV